MNKTTSPPGSIMGHARRDEASDHSRPQLEKRAAELAEIRGLTDGSFHDEDLQQARRELAGQQLPTPADAAAEPTETSLSRDPADEPGHRGHQVPDQVPEDEESARARLALEGVDAAERETMLADRRRSPS